MYYSNQYYTANHLAAIQQNQAMQRRKQVIGNMFFDAAEFLVGQAIKNDPTTSTLLYAGGVILAAKQNRPVKFVYEAINFAKAASRL